MRIGASTYSREPFLKQIDEIREAGFDYAELDLTWITWEPEKLQAEAEVLAKRIPLLTAHLPPSQFHQADLARFVGFMDALAPVGTEVFNAHFLEARSAPRIATGRRRRGSRTSSTPRRIGTSSSRSRTSTSRRTSCERSSMRSRTCGTASTSGTPISTSGRTALASTSRSSETGWP